MIVYDAVLKVENVNTAWALHRGRIAAVTFNENHRHIGQAMDFRRTLDGKFICTIHADEKSWIEFQKASLDGATLFAGDMPVVGPYGEMPPVMPWQVIPTPVILEEPANEDVQ